MNTIENIINEIKEIAELKEALLSAKGAASFQLAGCVPSQMEEFVSELQGFTQRVIITYDEQKAQDILMNYSAFDRNVLYYPAIDPMFFKADLHGNYISEQRLEVQRRLFGREPLTVITTAGAFDDALSSFEQMMDEIITIHKGDTVDTTELAEQLAKLGYSNESQVTAHGEFSIRGNIIDIFPFTEEAPYRLDLWGEDVETIKIFDSASQRSIEEAESVTVFPGGDGAEEDEAGGEPQGSFMDYFVENTLFVLDEPNRIFEKRDVGLEDPDGERRAASEDENRARLIGQLKARKTLAVTMLDGRSTDIRPQRVFAINTRSIQSYNGRFADMAEDLQKYRANGWRVLLNAAGRTRAERLIEELRENGVEAFYSEDGRALLLPGQIMVISGPIRSGFEYPDAKFSLISEVDIFGKRRARKKRKKYSGDPIKDFSDLNIGDYVVHENHGIGVYRGIERITVDRVEKDYMKIEYAGNSCLYVLATQFDRIQKYAGSEAARPRINRLGGKEWTNTKERARNAVQDIAGELVKLYAIRQARKGYRYSEDTVWQKEFEDRFEFEETDDQLRAIEAVKADMESSKIMDRLICGDVGFGKTEVAIRAAFKAVQDGKQVAFLVPTTILAQQHLSTFVQRMADYPVTIRLMNRFTSAADQRKIVAELKSGKADIVIGTHRLLSKDIAFKDLGLLIIDEEQRFGVTHKEKIKNLRKDVDVLTLSATPIPRTLHMSLVGIRDMSLLTEPPVDRVPIQTYVMEYTDEAVKEAIVREIARGGQVYYVYNRVENIEIVANHIQELLPQLRVQAAHGQMRGGELEQIMEDFIAGDIDVLVSTTIIETGLDISNVNTIIVQDADNFGLSQLYQLRGRVGRANRTAYAFLLYRRDKLIREVAEKRLKAIREFSDLGSGIKIAMRDLEIRGAGNILGAEQSGHMEAIGYELYCKMLNEAVLLLKGDEIPADYETSIELDIDGYIPDTYIKNEYEKLNMYKKISGITSAEDLDDIQEELLDRFGPVPKVVGNLLSVALIKAKAHQVYVTEVSGGHGEYRIDMYKNAKIDTFKLHDFLFKSKGTLRFVADSQPYLIFKPAKVPAGVRAEQAVLLELFARMQELILHGDK